MADIVPFQGLRYNSALIDSLEQVITPPYDVLSDADQDRLHKQSPYNLVRLEYGKTYPSDSEAENRYTRAEKTLQQWLTEEILITDPENCFYLYEQVFSFNFQRYSRKGLFVALKLEPYHNRIVLPHELTMANPKADRLELLKRTKTNISPIFMLFPDQDNRMQTIAKHVTEQHKLFSITEQTGQTHSLWKIDNPVVQSELIDYLKPQQLLIADGHHRYETAANYQNSVSHHDCPGADYVLAVLVSMKEPGLLMLPTHRLLSNIESGRYDDLVKICEENFDLILLGKATGFSDLSIQQALSELTTNRVRLAMVGRSLVYALIARDGSADNIFPVELLHEMILKPFSAQVAHKASDRGIMSYHHDYESILNAPVSGLTENVAFLLEPLAVEDVFRRSLKGDILPQKTTFFYPKLPGGLVLRHLVMA